jgi:hypothetical protein
LVKSFGLEYKKKGVDEIGILYSKKSLSKDTDSHVIKNVTATKPYFSEHDFVAEYINHYGPDAENRAIQLIKDAKAGNGFSNKNADIIAHVEQINMVETSSLSQVENSSPKNMTILKS